MTARVLALDPGGTTGWATWTDSDTSARTPTWSGGHITAAEHHLQLGALIENQAVQDYTVVCESFEFRQGKQRGNLNLMSKEYIGVTKYICKDRRITFKLQTAGMAKAFITDSKIKAMGLWMPGMTHQMDAMRHLLYYLINERGMVHLAESWKTL